MRYDKAIYFQTFTKDYDKSTGNYVKKIASEVKRMASISDTNLEMIKVVYGGLKQNVLSIHIQNHFKQPFDKIRVKDKAYSVDKVFNLRNKQIFICSGN